MILIIHIRLDDLDKTDYSTTSFLLYMWNIAYYIYDKKVFFLSYVFDY